MNKLLILSISVILISASFQSCTPKEKTSTPQVENTVATETDEEVKPGFIHAVYFWLKKDNPALLDEFINEGLPKLAKVPSIQSVAWGPPGGQPRDVVDNSYDLAWIVNFANAEDEGKYQVDPLHLEFVEKYKPLFERVQVYDNAVTHYHSSE